IFSCPQSFKILRPAPEDAPTAGVLSRAARREASNKNVKIIYAKSVRYENCSVGRGGWAKQGGQQGCGQGRNRTTDTRTFGPSPKTPSAIDPTCILPGEPWNILRS